MSRQLRYSDAACFKREDAFSPLFVRLYDSVSACVSLTGSAFNPYDYTKGRWLDRDKDRREARKLRFDFDALLDVAITCSPGARHVTHCEKKEGGFNRVFMIHMDNGSTVVARLPTRVAGPPGLTVSSEVATLQFVKERTKIPVPRVLSWAATPENSVGAEYMVLEAMPGVPLKDVWNNMPASQHLECIRSLGRLCKQLCQISFPAYGALYLNTEAPAAALKIDDTFCLGPVCAPHHWGCGIDTVAGVEPQDIHRGPWNTVEDYLSGLIERTRCSLSTVQTSQKEHTEMLDALQQTESLLATTETFKTASGAILSHADFHTRNIFVDADDHTKVTGIIDWQSAAVEPAFVFAAETPDFAAELPDVINAQGLTAEEEAANAKVRADVEYCGQAWAVMQQVCDKLRPASLLDPTLLRMLAAPSFGWADKAIILETLLSDLAKEWESLGLPGQSIYQPTRTEEEVQRLDEYQAKRRMQEHLVGLLRCDNDGWVPEERWEEVLPRYRLEYSRFVESVIDTEDCKNDEDRAKAVALADRLWPYDQR